MDGQDSDPSGGHPTTADAASVGIAFPERRSVQGPGVVLVVVNVTLGRRFIAAS